MIDEKTFYPGFLENLTIPELVILQHDLRKFPEDRPYLNQVLKELSKREKRRKQMIVVINLSVEFDAYKLRALYRGDDRELDKIILDDITTYLEEDLEIEMKVKNKEAYIYLGAMKEGKRDDK